MRMAIILLAALACASCASQAAGGFASYDVLRRATEACAAKGGRLALVRNGDAQSISDYTCEKSKVSAQ